MENQEIKDTVEVTDIVISEEKRSETQECCVELATIMEQLLQKNVNTAHLTESEELQNEDKSLEK